jgi:transcriptional regulator with XRE-family HTH domain
MIYREKLKQLRTSKRITRKELASQLGKSEQIIYYWETGKRNPCVSDIKITAGILNVPVSEISDIKDFGGLANASTSTSFLGSDAKYIDKNIKECTNFTRPEAARLKEIRNRIIEVSYENSRLVGQINRYKSLINNLSHIIYVKNVKYKYKLVNSAFIDTFGGEYNLEDFISFKATDIYGYEEISEILKWEQFVFNNKEKISNKQIKIPRTHKVGLLSIVPRFNQTGDVIEIVCSIKDITDLSEAVDMMRELETAMGMIDQAVWIAIYNSEKNKYAFTYTTANFEKIHNISVQALNHNFFAWENSVFEKDRATLHQWLNLEKYPKKLEYRIVSETNKVRWVSNKITRMGNTIFGVITDIDDFKNQNKVDG